MIMGDSKTFHIVENYSHEHKFDGFKEDFLKGMNKDELRKKWEVPPSVWRDFRNRIEAEFGVKRRKGGRPKRVKRRNTREGYLLQRDYKGNVTIRRWVDKKYYSYGTYPSSTVAEKVAKELVNNNWDKYLAYELLNKHGVWNSKRCLLPRLLRRDI